MRGSFKSRTYRRVHVRTPGGRTVLHMKRRAPEKPHCANCRIVLHGTVRALPFEIRKLSKTERRPQRPFGGVLCSSCARAKYVTASENNKIEVGTLCIKIAGRDAGQKCVILSIKENNALVDGETRRRNVNLSHLNPIGKIEIKKDASRADVVKAFDKLGVKLVEKKSRTKTERTMKVSRSGVKVEELKKASKKVSKK